MTTHIQSGPWQGWPNGATIDLADEPAVALFSAVAKYRADTGRHDADKAPLVMPVGGLRTVAECLEMRRAYDIYKGLAAGSMSWALAIYAKYNMLKSSNARPSPTSPHVSGYCADIASAAFFEWMVQHGAAYGWHQTLVRENDPRHFEYKPGTATAALNVHSLDGSATPPPENQETNDVTTFVFDATAAPSADGVIPNGAYFKQEGDGPLRVMTPQQLALFRDPATAGKFVNAHWDVEFLRQYTKTYGIEMYSGQNNDIQFSGWVIYADKTKPVYMRPYPPSALSADDVAKLGAAIKVPTPDLSPILMAIAGIPAAVVKAFGALFPKTPA